MPKEATKIVGNDYKSDNSLGFKSEIEGVFESYAANNVQLHTDLDRIVSSPIEKANLKEMLMESVNTNKELLGRELSSSRFYDTYAKRLDQLVENSLVEVARESVMTGYSPIMAYNPFFVKKQWVACIFKDVLMTEIPNSPLINIAFEKNYLKNMQGKKFEIPDVYYDSNKMAELMDDATGLKFDSTIKHALPLKNVDVLTPAFIPGIVVIERSETLTHDIHVIGVDIDSDGAGALKYVSCDIRIDIPTLNFVNGDVRWVDPLNASNVVSDQIIGKVDFETGQVTLVASNDKVKNVYLAGTTENRFNGRSLSIERKVEQLQFTLPESGPRINTEITVEEATDAFACGQIDLVAYNVDKMGSTLSNMEDYTLRTGLAQSFDLQKKNTSAVHGFDRLIEEGGFNALPYDGFTNNITDWMKDSREYFERMVGALKKKLRTPEAVVVAVAHPNCIRYLDSGINWIMSDDTEIGGLKISYNFGVITTAQDRVHIVTSMYLDEDEGIRMIVLPLTDELITFKNYKYNMVIDRGYRNPVHSLAPNIMATHRHKLIEVLPVQGVLDITGRDSFSPDSLKRP